MSKKSFSYTLCFLMSALLVTNQSTLYAAAIAEPEVSSASKTTQKTVIVDPTVAEIEALPLGE
ncbi:MAG: hypothetical protein K2Q34_06510 [Alphaproteobacteria bacterium]|nr:hypothetical protein [Alphaproteobacteria bacterium]